MNTGLLRRQRGALMIMYMFMLPVIFAFAGLALDMGMIYNRKTQLQTVSDRIALAAAQQLNGTAAGITAAGTRAQIIAQQAKVSGDFLVWNAAALRFSDSPDTPDAGWLSAADAQAAPADIRYARVDTRQIDPDLGRVQPMFLDVLPGVSPAGLVTDLAAVAVAGKSELGITPFAICAMDSAAIAQRINPGGTAVSERVEYGFRYGVGYNLLKLNPTLGATDGEMFLVNPIDAPGQPNVPSNTDDSVVAPFICNGELSYSTLSGGQLNLRRISSFSLWQELNSRFGNYAAAACSTGAAPPDTNIMAYTAPSWLGNLPAALTAQESSGAGQPLRTIADLAPPLPASAPGNYGTLWAFGAARTYPGNTAVPRTQMNTLYPGSPATNAPVYPGPPPYLNPGGSYKTAPAIPGRALRRVLNIPLLACPVPAGVQVQANVLAIGRFLLTGQATATVLPGEFGGTVEPGMLAQTAELFR